MPPIFFVAASPGSKSIRCQKDFVVSLEKRQVALGDLSGIAVAK
jgi:hypothetical protein